MSLGIALYHFAGHRIFSGLSNQLLIPVFSLIRHQGKVSAFFVISVFALGYSVGRRKITGRYLISFLKRRLIRLSIPYWFTIGFVVITTWLATFFINDYDNRLPGFGSIIAHLLYVYPLFHYQPILEVFWTLVHTVQFYFAFILFLFVMQKIWPSEDLNNLGAFLFFSLTGILSTIFFKDTSAALCFKTWHMFCLGLLAYWLHKKWISWWVAISLIFCVALTVFLRYDPHKLFAILTTLLLVLASHLGKLSSWLKNSTIQFLGRISYSLFLIHGTIGWRVLSVGDRLTGHNTFSAIIWLIVATACSILCAYYMYIFIEKPSVLLSKRYA